MPTWIRDNLIGWEEELPQREPVVDLGFEAPSLQGRDDLLGDAVFGVSAAAVKRDAADVQLAQMRVQIVFRDEPLTAPGAKEWACVPLHRRVVGADMFSGTLLA